MPTSLIFPILSGKANALPLSVWAEIIDARKQAMLTRKATYCQTRLGRVEHGRELGDLSETLEKEGDHFCTRTRDVAEGLSFEARGVFIYNRDSWQVRPNGEELARFHIYGFDRRGRWILAQVEYAPFRNTADQTWVKWITLRYVTAEELVTLANPKSILRELSALMTKVAEDRMKEAHETVILMGGARWEDEYLQEYTVVT